MRVREARQGAVHLEHVADGDDALRGVGALEILDSAEHVVIEAVRSKKMDTKTICGW